MLYFCLGLALGALITSIVEFSSRPLPKRRLTMCFVRPGKRRKRVLVVENEGGDWDKVQKVCIELMAAGRLRIADLQGVDECRDYLARRG